MGAAQDRPACADSIAAFGAYSPGGMIAGSRCSLDLGDSDHQRTSCQYSTMGNDPTVIGDGTGHLQAKQCANTLCGLAHSMDPEVSMDSKVIDTPGAIDKKRPPFATEN